MTLPFKGGARQVVLGNPAAVGLDPAGATELPTVNSLQSFTDTTIFYGSPNFNPTQSVPQPSFYASQHWYSEYPDECITIVSEGLLGRNLGDAENFVNPLVGASTISSTYPTDIVYSYNPASPYFDPVPDPNGTIGNHTDISGSGGGGTLFPRWHSDPPFDMTHASSYDFWESYNYFPKKNHVYTVSPFGAGLPGGCSANLSVINLQSEVFNEDTSTNEYYDFEQQTFEYSQSGTLGIPNIWEICCWNDGTVIEGTVGFSSIDVTTVALENPTTPGYGFGGMEATTGSTITQLAGTTNFTVTINSAASPVIINVPSEIGKITFISDFWITSVTAPT
jgi:hypothetical protein